MNKIIFIGGLARSGKSSTLEILKNLEIPCYSTSALLHQFYHRLGKAGQASYYNPWEKQDKEDLRKTLITLAEDVLVPVFGREIFAHAVIRQANLDPAPLVAVETVGGEEFRLGLEVNKKEWVCWNIRRDSELKGVDLRELLEEGVDIWNNGSLLDLSYRIKAELNSLERMKND